jgi:hypothetical protein
MQMPVDSNRSRGERPYLAESSSILAATLNEREMRLPERRYD